MVGHTDLLVMVSLVHASMGPAAQSPYNDLASWIFDSLAAEDWDRMAKESWVNDNMDLQLQMIEDSYEIGHMDPLSWQDSWDMRHAYSFLVSDIAQKVNELLHIAYMCLNAADEHCQRLLQA